MCVCRLFLVRHRCCSRNVGMNANLHWYPGGRCIFLHMHVLQQLLPLTVWAQAMHPLRSLMHRNAESKQVLRLLVLSSIGTPSQGYDSELLHSSSLWVIPPYATLRGHSPSVTATRPLRYSSIPVWTPLQGSPASDSEQPRKWTVTMGTRNMMTS